MDRWNIPIFECNINNSCTEKKYRMLQVSFSKIAHFERTKTSMIFVFIVWLLWAIYLGIPAAGSKIAGSTVVLMTSLLDLHCHG
jgi:hypothetical protein